MTDPMKHNANTYRNGKCRCDVCREDHRIKTAANRKERLARGVIHGSRSSYDAGCRCDYCLGARRLAYAAERGYPVTRKRAES